MKCDQRPFGNCKVLALYQRGMVLCEMHAYLVVAEAVDHGDEESLKRGGKIELRLILGALYCSGININRQPEEEHFTIALANQGSMKDNY